MTQTHALCFAYSGEHDPNETRSEFSKAYPGAIIQTVSQKAAENGFFVRMIAAQTISALHKGSLLAKKPEVDLLLRLAGTTQISEAITHIGSKGGEPFLLVVADSRPLGDNAPTAGARKLPVLPLSELELRRVERAALLSARRA